MNNLKHDFFVEPLVYLKSKKKHRDLQIKRAQERYQGKTCGETFVVDNYEFPIEIKYYLCNSLLIKDETGRDIKKIYIPEKSSDNPKFREEVQEVLSNVFCAKNHKNVMIEDLFFTINPWFNDYFEELHGTKTPEDLLGILPDSDSDIVLKSSLDKLASLNKEYKTIQDLHDEAIRLIRRSFCFELLVLSNYVLDDISDTTLVTLKEKLQQFKDELEKKVNVFYNIPVNNKKEIQELAKNTLEELKQFYKTKIDDIIKIDNLQDYISAQVSGIIPVVYFGFTSDSKGGNIRASAVLFELIQRIRKEILRSKKSLEKFLNFCEYMGTVDVKKEEKIYNEAENFTTKSLVALASLYCRTHPLDIENLKFKVRKIPFKFLVVNGLFYDITMLGRKIHSLINNKLEEVKGKDDESKSNIEAKS